MTAWFERRAGSEESLLALYDAVGAAEELDLEEEAHEESLWAEVRLLQNWPSDEADEVCEAIEAEAYADEAEHLNMSQALGIVEHLLGGQPMRGGEQQAL